MWARPATARAGRRGVGSGQLGQVTWRCTRWGVARRVAASQASAGRGRIGVEFEGPTGQGRRIVRLHMAGSQDGGVVRWFPPVVLPSGPGPGRERFPRD